MKINFLIVAVILTLWVISVSDIFSQLSWGRLRKIEEEDEEKAKKVERWLDNRQSYQMIFRFLRIFFISLVATLVYFNFQKGITNLFSGIHKQHTLYTILVHIAPAFVIAIALLTVLEIVIRVVDKFDLRVLEISMPVVELFKKTLFFPIILVINFVMKFFNRKSINDDDKPTTEDEIMSLLENDDQEEDDHSLDENEKQMIKGIFDLDDTVVREIMTPRVDVVALPISAPIQDALELFMESGHSRIPVYHSTVDEINGIIMAKDFLDRKALNNKSLKDLAHKPIYIPETKSTLDLLNELKGSRNHFSVVIDEYGGTAGIITMEDILEEIVGEIHDEHEKEEDTEIKAESDGSYTIEARTLLDEVEELFDIRLPENEDVDTIGGLISAKFGKIPEPGEEMILEDILEVKVMKADKRRVLTINVKKIEQ